MAKVKLRGRGGKLILKGLKGQVSSVAVSPDGGLVAGVDWKGGLAIWEPWTQAALKTAEAHEDRAQGVCFLDDGRRLVTCGWDRRVRVWDAASLALLQEHEEAAQGRSYVRFWHVGAAPDGRWLIAHLQRGARHPWRAWPVEGGQVRFDKGKNLGGHAVLLPEADAALTLRNSKDGLRVSRRTVRSRAPIWSLHLPNRAHNLCVTPDGLRAAVDLRPLDYKAGEAQTLALIALDEGAELRRFPLGTKDQVGGLVASPDGRLIAGQMRNQLVMFDTLTGAQLLPEGWRHKGLNGRMSFTPDGTALISGGWDKAVRMWDLTDILRALPAPGEAAPPSAAEPSPAADASEPERPTAEATGVDPEAEAPDGLSDPDALFAAGYYRAALKAFKKHKLVLAGHKANWLRAFRHVDRSLCLARLGDEDKAREAHWKAQDASGHSTNLYNSYAWALFEAGELDKARLIGDASFTRVHGSSEYCYTANTWLSILDAQRDPGLLPQLACHRMELPTFSDSKPLFEAHAEALDAFVARAPDEGELALMKRWFHNNPSDLETWSNLAVALLALDPRTWTPEVARVFARAQPQGGANPAVAAVPDPAAAMAITADRVNRWLTDKLAYRGSAALRPLVMNYLQRGERPRGFLGKVRRGGLKHATYGDFNDIFARGMAGAAETVADRLELLALLLDGLSAHERWKADVERQRATQAAIIDGVAARHDDGYALLADIFGRADDPEARAGVAHMLARDRPRALVGAALAGAPAQVALLPQLWAHDRDAALPLVLSLAASTSKAVRAAVVELLVSHRGAEPEVRALTQAGKKAAREVGAQVLERWGL